MKNFFFVLLIGISLTGYTKTEINNIKNKESNKSSYGFNIYQQVTSTNIIFVDSSATGANNGTSWGDAFTSFQSALDIAESGDTIWIAKGTYYPSSGYDLCDDSGDSTRYYHFRMKEDVKIYGGFAGNEDPAVFNLNDRDLITNNTILSGDIGTRGDSTDNCYHVFYHPKELNLSASALLYGVTITEGNADGSDNHEYGGGMYNKSSSPTLTNVTISKNSSNGGGGISNFLYSSPILNNVTISENTTIGVGGGILNHSSSSPILTNITMSGNSARLSGGGMYNYSSSSPTLTNVIISGNTTPREGGGIVNSSFSSPILNNVTISGNTAALGGGISISQNSSLTLNNSIIWGNTSSYSGNEIYINSSCSVILNYCCYKNNSENVYNGGTFTGTNHNITVYPQFADTVNGDYRLINTSPCLDAGDTIYNSELYDIRGVGFGRKLLKTDSSQTGPIDMGAYEYKKGVDLLNFNHIFVDSSATGANNGTSWADAFTSLQSALDIAESGDTIWIAEGTYYPSSGYNFCDDSGDSTRYYHFRMKEGVKIFGGFAGNEDPAVFNLNDRDFITNTTILSGDIGTREDSTDNCYHVFYHPDGLNLTASALLDGVSITGGNADGKIPHYNGGGMYHASSSPTLNNVNIIKNTATNKGGGIYNSNSSPNLTNITITENTAGIGGGMSNDHQSSPTLKNVTIIENTANTGGGIYNFSSSPTLNNVTINLNTATTHNGGGMYNNQSSPILSYVTINLNTALYSGGGIINYDHSSTTLTNVTISGNRARSGGGMFNDRSSPILTNIIIIENSATSGGGGILNYQHSYPTLTNVKIIKNTANLGGGIYNVFYGSPTLNNVTICKNTAEEFGGGLYEEGGYSSTTLNNSIIWGNSASSSGNEFFISSEDSVILNYSCYKNDSGDINNEGTFTATNHNITADPQFVNADNGDSRLLGISPCVDAGDDSYNSELYDIRGIGFGRKLLKTDSLQIGPIDMGAYEYKNGIDVLFNCGSGYNITDIDGNVYETVQIGLTCWTKQNMKTTHYANGDSIRFAEGYYAAEYPDEAANINRFGRLYSWYSAVGVPENSTGTPIADPNHHIQGICPDGWYLPNETTYSELMAWGGDAIRSDSLWLNGLTGTNSTGFNALPAGFYNTTNEEYCFLLGNTFFWCSNSESDMTAYYVELQCHCPELLFNKAILSQKVCKTQSLIFL